MRNPNGYGSVIKLSGNRRKPYIARVTVGWKDNGQPIYHILDSFSSRADAMICLAEYNDAQYSVDYRHFTMAELFDKMQELEYPRLSASLRLSLNAAYKHCKNLHNIKYRTIKKHMMQRCIDQCERAAQTKGNIKNLFSHLDALALELDIINRGYSSLLVVPAPAPKEKSVFTDEEVKRLWDRRDMLGAEIAIVLLHTGLRKTELLTLKQEDVNLNDGTITGGIKSAAGKNRVIPIHHQIDPIIRARMDGGELLYPISKTVFEARFAEAMNGMSHTSHECRHTFRSKLDSAGANKVSIDRIMGHKSGDVGERVYTHKSIEELKKTVEMLSYGL